MEDTSSLHHSGGQVDLQSQSGVARALFAIRQSSLTPYEKNELRDLIFEYTSNGRDEGVRRVIEQRILESNIDIPQASNAVGSAPSRRPLAFGAVRSAPKFATPESYTAKNEPQPSTAQVASAVPEVAESPVAENGNVLDQVNNENILVNESVPPVPEATVGNAQPVNQQVGATTSEQQDSVAVPKPDNSPSPLPVHESVLHEGDTQVAELTARDSSPDSNELIGANTTANDQYIQRIREIKALVNDKVGNPVNLVDIDNEVGREYMTALLDAMKKMNSGGGAQSAMERLESAFAKVKSVLDGPKVAPTNSPSRAENDAKDVSESTLAIEQNDVHQKTQTQSDESALRAENVAVSENEQDINPVVAEDEKNSLNSKLAPEKNSDKHPQEMNGGEDVVATASVKVEESAQDVSDDSGDASRWQQSKVVQTPIVKPLSATPNPLPVPPTKKVSEQPAEAIDPLYAPEISEGLNQLLQEWSLFKKSGLFGTGPNGREHPLFKKIASLQIPLLLAGRFEGATQEIKQSITDYMNGWRYEQGIIYEQGETFEHYLRRVIRHIIDLQQRKKDA